MNLGHSLRIASLALLGVLYAAASYAGPGQSESSPATPAASPATAQPEVKPAPPTPIAEKKAELGDDETWSPDWDKIVEEALPADLLSAKREGAVKALCPQFRFMSDADKRAFWAYFFQALAGAEAGLRPTAEVRHTQPEVAVIDTVTKHTVKQEGLLQLTYMDSQRYNCDFDWQADKDLPVHDPNKTILQPKNNLLCGIKILDNQLLNLKKPVLTKSSYWVTLRPGTYSYLLFMKQMKNVPAACGSTPIRHGWFSRNALPPGAQPEPAKPTASAAPAASPSAQTKATGEAASANQPAGAAPQAASSQTTPSHAASSQAGLNHAGPAEPTAMGTSSGASDR